MLGIRRKIVGVFLVAGKQSGVALIITLWILVFLIIIVSEFSFLMRIELKVSTNLKEETQAYFLALAGVESAINEIMGIYRFQYLDSNGNLIFAPGRQSDYLNADKDSQELVTAPQRTNIPLSTGILSYRITDQNRKFNINSLRNRNPRPDSPYNRFRKLLLYSGVEAGVELDTIIDSVIDWLDRDENHGLHGAESDWYEEHYEEMGFMEPYTSKNNRFDTMEELLMVRGMAPEILYGTSKAREMGLIELDEDDTGEIKYRGIYNYICVLPHSSSRINLNTISDELLIILYPEIAEKIIMERSANGGIYNRRGGGKRLGYTTNRSNTFLIESTGRVAGSEVTRTIKTIVWKRGSRRNFQLTYKYWNDNSPISEVETDINPPESEENDSES